MQGSFKQCALAGCVSVMVGGCAMNPGIAPEYRLSSSSVSPAPGASMLQRGRAQLDAGLDALAIESFRGEIRADPDSADAYNGLAVAYGRIGRDDLAQRYFETALAKDPANIKAQTNLAKLNGGTAPIAQLAMADVQSAILLEPVSVTAASGDDRIGNILDNLEAPALALADMPAPTKVDAQPEEVLARQGVLSTRFIAAPARLATKPNVTLIPANPPQPPHVPKPFLPPANLPSDYRTNGTRLERVSLGEVRLITRPEPAIQPSNDKPDFASFGDRLAVWLPQSMATEHTGNAHGMIESTVIMAAIERAEEGRKQAMAGDGATKDLPEFAYLFFHSDDDIANV